MAAEPRTTDPVEVAARPDRLFGGRFRAARVLKTRHGVETFLGTDVERREAVVIKAVRASLVPPGVGMRLEHEAHALREVRGASLPPLLDFGQEEDLVYLVVPYVDGPTLAERLRAGRIPPREAIAIARSVLAALDAAHERGVLHRDVKPANVILKPGERFPEAVLIDFGLARSDWLDAGIRDEPAGTVRYMSPEQAGLIERGVDARSDLYSLGVLLYECLAGVPPFRGETIGAVLREHLCSPPPPLQPSVPEVPRALEDVVGRLLRKDPRDRYRSARAVIADLDEIAAALDRGVSDPPVVVGLHDARETLAEPSFVGREAELRALEEALARARGGAASLVTVEAESGGGKTRLLDELARRAARDGAWVLRGQGVDRAAQRPLEVLSGVVRAILVAAAGEPALAVRLGERLGEHADAAIASVPALAGVLGPPARPGGLRRGAHAPGARGAPRRARDRGAAGGGDPRRRPVGG
jgi:two-component system sensor kinase